MRILSPMVLSGILVLSAPAQAQVAAERLLTPYNDVRANPERYLGKSVTWIGVEVCSSITVENNGPADERRTYLAVDSADQVISDHPFMAVGPSRWTRVLINYIPDPVIMVASE